ncbi:outer membrane protein [Geofilum rubicundum JCM 15548]|uniref:Outer membrane protein n=1 Tax=Geofilum rubicundum JCM 15548 TaxID=1236989 RepID=A0A0E9LVG9_9BACT|nr:outer membrane protein [Geofilum rubicundum JCM 15548]
MLYTYNAFTFIEYTRGLNSIGDLPTETTDLKPDEGQDAQELYDWRAATISTNLTLENFFKYGYVAINRANVLIEQVECSAFPEAFKNQIIGEALVLRSWSYFHLIRVFGLVPVHNAPVRQLEDTSAPLAPSLDALYDLVIADLIRAEEMLEVNKSVARVGRVDKVAAQSILAKIYLTIASSKQNGVKLYRDMTKDVDAMYESAAFWAGKVMNDQTDYFLDPNLTNVYDVNQPHGPEHIFILSHDRSGANEGNYSKTPLMFMPWVNGVPFFLKYEDGRLVRTTHGWEVYRVSPSFFATFHEDDQRGIDLIHDEVYDADGNVVGSIAQGSFTHPFTVKYQDPEFEGDRTSARPFLIRFADIALTYAEAVGPTTEGYAWVNAVRARAGLQPLEAGLSVADFRQAVIQERAWELCYEGHYLFDLRRTGTVTTKVPQATGLDEDEASFYPLPQREQMLNDAL